MDSVKSPYYYLSKYRSVLMGLSILWVVWFHSIFFADFFHVGVINKAFDYLKAFGYGGVDVFLLISGMGIYNSLEKNDISTYIKNRIRKITPIWWTYLLICLLLGIFVFHQNYTVTQVVGFATFTGFWLDLPNQGNWYVYAIVLFYLISPILHSVIKNSKNKTIACITLVVISLIISVSSFNTTKITAFSRLPVFILGMYVSSSLKETKMKKSHWIVCFASFVVGVACLAGSYVLFRDHIRSYGLCYYSFILIAPSLALMTAKVFDKVGKYLKFLSSPLSIFGKSSLEILLASDFVFGHLEFYLLSDRLTALAMIIISIIIGIAFHYCIEFFKNKIEKTLLEKPVDN